MISRRLGGGDEAYFTYVEETDNDANADSALSWNRDQSLKIAPVDADVTIFAYLAK
jgi:hypothetical protein